MSQNRISITRPTRPGLPAHVLTADDIGNRIDPAITANDDGTYSLTISIPSFEFNPNDRSKYPPIHGISFSRIGGTPGNRSAWPVTIGNMNHPDLGMLQLSLRVELVAEPLSEVQARIADARAAKAARTSSGLITPETSSLAAALVAAMNKPAPDTTNS